MSAYITKPEEPEDTPLSTRNVNKLTTFQLRQELERRGAFDIPEEQVNHKSIMQRLVQVLLEEERRVANEREANREAERIAQLNAAKAAREQKKLEALERSKLRQQNPKYFEAISESNKAPEKKDLQDLEEVDSSGGTDVAEQHETSTEDPFSPFAHRGRAKIHTR